MSVPVTLQSMPLSVFRHCSDDIEVDHGGDETIPIIYTLTGNQRVERRRRGIWSEKPCGVGLMTVSDPEEATGFAIRGRAEALQIILPVAEIEKAAGLGRRYHVRECFLEADPELELCANRALVALHDGSIRDRLLLSSIALRLSARLIDRPMDVAARTVGGLSRRQVRRVEEFIAAQVAEPIASSPSLDELAAEASLSLHHFAREFRRTMGVTPYAYVLRRRLERARLLLMQSDMQVAEIGRCSGFPSPAHFTERFRREMGVTPGALRQAIRG